MYRNLIVLSSVLMLFATNSYASKARLSALQFADFWRDNQNVFNYPQYASDLGQYATLELGATGTGTGVHAEGGFAKKTTNGIYGIYLGHHDATLSTIYTASAVSAQSNPFFLYYATGNKGFGLNFSYSNIKTTGNKEFSIGGTFGMKAESFDFGSNVTLYSKGETGAVQAKVLPAVELNFNTTKTECKWYGEASIARVDNGATTETGLGLKAGVQHHMFKLGETGTMFFGTEAAYAKFGVAKSLRLPVYAGIEAPVMGWLNVRGAISQTLIGFTEAAATVGNKDINANDTVASLGLGIKHGSFELDGLMAAAGSGQLNGTSFLTSTSVTYRF